MNISRKRRFRAIAVLLGFLLVAATCDGDTSFREGIENLRDQIREADTQGYMLVYAGVPGGQIEGRWSTDGATWSDVDLGVLATPHGPGAATDSLGLLRVVVVPDPTSKIGLTWGLGAVFEDRAQTVTSQQATSAPSAVEGKDLQWIVAYRDADGRIAVRVYDHDQRRFRDRDYAPVEDAFTDGEGRPALARLGDQIVMAWWRSGSLRFATGPLGDDGLPTWPDKYGLSFPRRVGPSCYGDVASDPALTHDHDRFLLAFTRRTAECEPSGDDVLHADRAFVYASADGLSWGEPMAVRHVPLDSTVNIAGRADGSVVLAAVGSSGVEVARWRDGTWSPMSDVFGSTPPIWTWQFALIGTGRPPVSS